MFEICYWDGVKIHTKWYAREQCSKLIGWQSNPCNLDGFELSIHPNLIVSKTIYFGLNDLFRTLLERYCWYFNNWYLDRLNREKFNVNMKRNVNESSDNFKIFIDEIPCYCWSIIKCLNYFGLDSITLQTISKARHNMRIFFDSVLTLQTVLSKRHLKPASWTSGESLSLFLISATERTKSFKFDIALKCFLLRSSSKFTYDLKRLHRPHHQY